MGWRGLIKRSLPAVDRLPACTGQEDAERMQRGCREDRLERFYSVLWGKVMRNIQHGIAGCRVT